MPRWLEGGGGFRLPWPGGAFGEPSASVGGVPVAPGTALETAIEWFRNRAAPQQQDAPSELPPPAAESGPPPSVDSPPALPPTETVPGEDLVREVAAETERGPPLPHFPHMDRVNAGVPPQRIWEAWHRIRERGDRTCNTDAECEFVYGGGFVFPHAVHDDIYRGPDILDAGGEFGADMPRMPIPFPPIGTDVPTRTQFMETAAMGQLGGLGPIMREVIRQAVKRAKPKLRPLRRIRRRRIEEPPQWPNRPRRYGEPIPAPRRGPRPQIPRQTPGEPEWTSPYPQIETRPVPLPTPPPSVPVPTPSSSPRESPQRLPPSVPPSGVPWPMAPVPLPSPTAPSTAPRRSRQRVGAAARVATPWPRVWPALGALAAGALARAFSPAPARSSWPLRWAAPDSAPVPDVVPDASPAPLPDVAAQPNPLTALQPSALPYAQPQPQPHRCRCPSCKTKKQGKRRKCKVRGNVVWQSGAKKGQLAGTKCQTFGD